MYNSMDQDKLLEKYLQNKLTTKEREQFELQLESDPDLKKEVEFELDVKRAISANEDENFRNLLAEFESEVDATENVIIGNESSSSRFPTKWLIAASVVLIAALTFVQFNQSSDPQDLFAQNFKPYTNVTHPITRGESSNTAKTMAFIAYESENYAEAVTLFDELYAVDQEPYYLFYKANALIQLDRASEAIPLLKQHLQLDDDLTTNSNWYLAMAYLSLQDTENAKLALEKVVAANAYGAEKAKQLLDEL